MSKRNLIYSGKAKSLYAIDKPYELVLHFRDDATAFDGTKKAVLHNKGKINNFINAFIMEKLQAAGIATHFLTRLNDNESLVKHLQMIPVECVVRNITAGNLSRRLGVEEGLELKPPIFEFYFKSDALHDPMINETHIIAFGWANADEIKIMKTQSLRINDVLKPLFEEAGMLLVDYKLEFGRFDGEIVLGDEFTPDGCRIWDAKTLKKLDKDRFRRDLGDVIESYTEVLSRLGISMD